MLRRQRPAVSPPTAEQADAEAGRPPAVAAAPAPSWGERLRAGPVPWVLAAGAVALLLTVPLWASGYQVKFLTELYMLITMATAWNLIGGLAGYASFGHVAFFGLGAYASALTIVRLGWPFPLSLLAGALVALGFALLVGWPILRLRGHYFAIATFGLAEALRQVAMAASAITEGGKGVNVPAVPPPAILRELLGSSVAANRLLFYALMLGLLVATLFVWWWVSRGRLGYGLRAIRADEDAAATLGVDCTRYKLAAFALSAVPPALAGGLYASWINYIDPVTVFNVDYSVSMVIMTLLGGAGLLWGPVVGGVLLQVISETLWGQFLELHTAFLGTVLVLTVLFLPRGVLALVRGGPRRPSLAALRQHLRRYSV